MRIMLLVKPYGQMYVVDGLPNGIEWMEAEEIIDLLATKKCGARTAHVDFMEISIGEVVYFDALWNDETDKDLHIAFNELFRRHEGTLS